MENTEKVLFSASENQPVWYVALDAQKWIGPLSASEVVERIHDGEITWAHYGWRKEQSKWIRLCDIPAFSVAVPMAPSAPIKVQPKKAESRKTPPPVPEQTQWFLYYSDSQFGPFGEDEIHRFLRIGKIHGDVHIWSEGMKGWEKLKTISTFSESIEESTKVRLSLKSEGAPTERRKAPRAPLVARSLMAAGGKVISGVCRDVSVGGMQVLTTEKLMAIGTKLKLNISNPDGAQGAIRAFVAEGVVVRQLEDGRGFSFRFEKISPEGKKAIEAYVGKKS